MSRCKVLLLVWGTGQINIVKPNSIIAVAENSSNRVLQRHQVWRLGDSVGELRSDKRCYTFGWQELENVNNFLNGVRSLGLPESSIFSPIELVSNESSIDDRSVAVVDSILALKTFHEKQKYEDSMVRPSESALLWPWYILRRIVSNVCRAAKGAEHRKRGPQWWHVSWK